MQKRWLVLGLGGVLGGLIFFLVYAFANGSWVVSTYQRILPIFFGVVAGVFLADAWYTRRKSKDDAKVQDEGDDALEQR
jgi:hypothetical protein